MILSALLLVSTAPQFEDWVPPALVPPARDVQPRFAPCPLGEGASVIAATPELEPLADVLSQHLSRLTGQDFSVASGPLGVGPTGQGSVILSLGGSPVMELENDEAFAIEVYGDHVALFAMSPDGVARGAARLLQLLARDSESGAWMFPATYVRDVPAHEWRGLMLDVARFPHSVDAVLESIDLAFLFGLNRVQLHLTDDQAFTFPSSLVPARTDPGADGKHRGYTKADLARIVRFAEARGIDIVPEIDMPAHSGWLVAERAELFGTVEAESGNAKSTGVINMARPDVYGSIETLLEEVAEVFAASPEIHLGGDEVWGRNLIELPEFAAFAKEHDLPVRIEDGAIDELLNHFLAHVTKTVIDTGKQPVLWEGFQPPKNESRAISPRTIIMSWNMKSRTPASLIDAGHSLVNANWEPLYIVPAQGWASRPADAWDWNPRSLRQRFGGASVDLAADAPLLGSQICVWEQRPEAIVPALLRTLPELSTRMWGSATVGDAQSFEGVSQGVRDLALAQLRPVSVMRAFDKPWRMAPLGTLFDGKLEIDLVGRGSVTGKIRYEISDSFETVVTAKSKALGEGPLTIDASCVVTAAMFSAEGARIGWPTRVRFQKGTPVLTFEAWQLPLGGDVTAANWFDVPAVSRPARIGAGHLAAPTPRRTEAINREQFAKVDATAHVDLRPLYFGVRTNLQRLDPERPRIWGRHAILATGEIEIPEAGEWTVRAKSRNGLARITVSDAATLTLEKNGSGEIKVQLAAGRHAVTIDHAVPDVHNDLQLTLQGPSDEAPRTLYELLAPLARAESEVTPTGDGR